MKLPELKNRFKNKYMIRIIAGVLTVAVVGSSATVYNVYAAKNTNSKETATEAASDTEDADVEDQLKDMLSDNIKVETKDIGKDETVYIIADNTGKAQSTIVSDWLKNPDGKDTLEDVSDLKEITNVKGDETFEQKGNALTWKADGNDIYYQGTTTKEAPVTEKITYYLDGKEISPEDLAGKSGNVKIRFDYTNNEKTTAKINGKEEEVCVPFVVVSGMVLNDNFTNLEVTNGKVVSNGAGNMVVGVALPGLKDSLNVEESDFSEDVTIPDYVEVTADVEDFSMDMTMSVVTSSSDLSVDGALDLSDLDDKIDDLTDAVDQLKDGSGELADGLDTLKNSMGEFSDGINSLQSGVAAYTDGAKTLADGIGTLKNQTSTLISGVGELKSSVNTLNNGMKTLDKAVSTKMTDKEKQAAQQQAKSAAEKAVEAQFADDSNPQSYNNIKAQAEAQFAGTLTSDANIADVKQRAAATINAQAGDISAAAQTQAAQQMGQNSELQAQMQQLSTAIAAAAKLGYATNPDVVAGKATEIATALMSAGITDQTLIAQISQSAAIGQLVAEASAAGMGDAEAASAVASLQQTIVGSAGQIAVATAQQVAPQTAEATVRGVAEQAKGTIGTSMADSVKTAAKTAAGQAAGQAAVEGAESAKQLIAQSIEKKDSKSGYSLVSGMDALNKAVNGMSDKMPSLTDGIDKLYNGSQTLTSKNAELNSGVSKLADGKNQIVLGVNKLASGSHELADGIVKFDEEGIEKLINSYNGDIKDLVDRIQAVMDAGSDYESFGGKADETVGSVKFIIKTDAIKADEE